MPFFGSGARSTQEHSHGPLAPVSLAGRTSENAPSPKRSTYRSIFCLRPPKGRALVFSAPSHRVGTAPLLQPHPEGVRPPVEGVREHPPGGHVGREGPPQHLLGQFYLVAEDERNGDTGFRSTGRIVRPRSR